MIAGRFSPFKAIGRTPPRAQKVVAHEWLGMPVVFAAVMTEPGQWRSVFYA